MKNKFVYILIVVLLIIGAVLFLLPQEPKIEQIQELTIAATVFPISDIARNVGRDEVKVVNILPPGASPHTFELTPSQVKELQNARVVFTIGHGLDDWAADIAKSVQGVEIFEVDAGIALQSFKFDHAHEHESGETHEHEQEGFDPHYWLSTENAKIIAENIAGKLIELDPQNKEIYQSNLVAYQNQLSEAKTRIQEIFQDLERKDLLVFHESWNYFAREFGLNIVGVFASSPGTEPTPRYLEYLNETAKEYNLTVVFSEPQLSPETIRPFVEDLGLELKVLDPLGGLESRNSFINLLLYNANVINDLLR